MIFLLFVCGLGQSLVAALRDELTSYYELVANIQSQLQPATLRQLLVWVAEPQFRLQWLAILALECQDKKGSNHKKLIFFTRKYFINFVQVGH